jgi:dihydroorotate dehydrogenase
MYERLRPWLFRLDAERAHDLVLSGLRLTGAVPPLRSTLLRGASPQPRLEQRWGDLCFPSPVGLAAGLDKNAAAIPSWFALGFGFVEVGTVTPLPQKGNPRPRLVRHPEAASLQNAMGFNNAGLQAMAKRLKRYPFSRPVLVNIGKNRDTPLDEAAQDYVQLARALSDHADAFVINISSPNTPGLRELESGSSVESLLAAVLEVTDRPVLLKLSPDRETERIVELAWRALTAGAAGFVLTNTTTDYSLLPDAEPFGGLSGQVLRQRSYEVLEAVAAAVRADTLLISVGGVDSGEEVWRRLTAGATLVELYTALIYHGPVLLRRIQDDLLRRLDEASLDHIGEAVGSRRTGGGA